MEQREELVQEALLEWVSYEKRHGTRSKQTCNQAIIQAYRKHNGRSRIPGECSREHQFFRVARTQEIYERALDKCAVPIGASDGELAGMYDLFMNYKLLIEEKKSLDDVEKEYILCCLEYFKGNRTHTAKHLKISLRGLRNKLGELSDDTFITPAPTPKELLGKKPVKVPDVLKPNHVQRVIKKAFKIKKIWDSL